MSRPVRRSLSATPPTRRTYPPVPGDFNLEVILSDSGTGNFTVAGGYQALAVMATPGGAVFTARHGDYGVIDTGIGGNKVILGDGNESVRGAPHDTLQGGSGNNQFLDGSAGQQLIFLGGAGNDSVFGGFGDTIGGAFGANITIRGAPGDTIGGPSGGNQFVDATAGSQWIDLGTGGDVIVWGGGNDTILGGANANVTVGGAPGNTIFGHGLSITSGFEFIDASRGGQYINLRSSENLLIWGGPNVTIDGGGNNITIAGAPGETITAAVSFVDGSKGNQLIVAGGISETIWGGAGDTIGGGSGNVTVGGAPVDTISAGHGNWFIDGSRGNQSIFGGPNDTMLPAGFGGHALIGFAGGNEMLRTSAGLLFSATSISGFNQTGGDRVFLGNPADTPDYVVGTATTDSAGNTTVTLHNNETITFIGISGVNNTFFTTH